MEHIFKKDFQGTEFETFPFVIGYQYGYGKIFTRLVINKKGYMS